MVIVKARFQGQNGSMGYRRGAMYTLSVEEKSCGFLGLDRVLVVTRLGYPKTQCPYHFIGGLLKNWGDIKVKN